MDNATWEWTELREAVSGLVNIEHQASIDRYSTFHSLHEGYAVLMEEIEEASEALEELKAMQKILWCHIRGDHTMMAKNFVAKARKEAEELAGEAIQCAAMAQKLLDYIDGE